MNEKIILASQSPRRKQLLEMANVDFEIIVEPTDEIINENLSLEEIAIQIALQKADVISKKYTHRKILAADTIVIIENEILGKPTDEKEAFNMLKKLSGKTHQVITGVAILENQKQILFADITEVTFNILTDEQIQYYISTYKPFDKAGSYAIQEYIGAIAINKINGCFYNVMGLPISKIIPFL